MKDNFMGVCGGWCSIKKNLPFEVAKLRKLRESLVSLLRVHFINEEGINCRKLFSYCSVTFHAQQTPSTYRNKAKPEIEGYYASRKVTIQI